MRRPAHLAIAAAVVAGIALIAFELGRGALGDGALALPDPCTRTAAVTGDGLDAQGQRVALGALDHAACITGGSREDLMLRIARTVDGGPPLPDDQEEALREGLQRAIAAEEDAGRLNGAAGWLLRQAVRFAPLNWVLENIGEVGPLIGR